MYINYPALAPRELFSDPPPPQDALTNNPTLLVSWWCTMFALIIILVRLSGRWIRTERLFLEDKIMALSLLPLVARMGCAHFVIRWGTNNALTEGLAPEDIWQREIGSKLVLPARIFYAAFLWTAKLTIAEFLRRLYSSMWKRSWEVTIQCIRWFLALTFIAVVVATLSECQPFSRYWQVVPDPGPHCRQGLIQLITMGVSDTITDLVLVAFPVPVILASAMPLKRKISLSFLFALSLSLIAITIYRVFETIDRNANQQFRSLVASFEILAAAAVANALVLGSFVRDRGAKKNKYKPRNGIGSDTGGTIGSPGFAREGSPDRPPTAKARHARAMSWGSDCDLAEDLGIRLGPEFQTARKHVAARPVPAAIHTDAPLSHKCPPLPAWKTNETEDEIYGSDDLEKDGGDPPAESPVEPEILTPRRMAFFDVGGLLEDGTPPSSAPRRASVATVQTAGSRTEGALPAYRNEMGGIEETGPGDLILRPTKSAGR